MVCPHGRFAALGINETGFAGLLHELADPVCQFRGSLARKSQPEYVFARGVALGTDSDHPGRHDCGLARTRSGDHEGWARWGPKDHLGLLVGHVWHEFACESALDFSERPRFPDTHDCPPSLSTHDTCVCAGHRS